MQRINADSPIILGLWLYSTDRTGDQQDKGFSEDGYQALDLMKKNHLLRKKGGVDGKNKKGEIKGLKSGYSFIAAIIRLIEGDIREEFVCVILAI